MIQQSTLLQLLLKHDCVRSQKRQKIFFWFSVKHDRLLVDALERDMRREARVGDFNLLAMSSDPSGVIGNGCKDNVQETGKELSRRDLDPLGDTNDSIKRSKKDICVDTSESAQVLHVCDYASCRRQFKRLEHLRRHSRMHTQLRPFHCQVCSKAFSRSDNLSTHVRITSIGFIFSLLTLVSVPNSNR